MKITFILAFYPSKPDGGYKIIYDYANGLVKRGHEVSLVYPRYYSKTIKKFPRTRSILQKFSKPKVNWHNIDERVKIFFIPEPKAKHIPDGDAVFTTFWAAINYMENYPPEKGVKFYSVQGYETWLGPEEEVQAALLRKYWKVVISKWLCAKLEEIGVPKKDMLYLPNSIDMTKYKLTTMIEDRSDTISMVYSPYSFKGGGLGIKTLKKIKESLPGIQAIIFSGFRRPFGIPDWITWVTNPTQDEIVKIYNKTSVFLSPSYTEGWHLPPAEAMSCGCALASTDIGGVKDYAKNSETALLSPPGDVDALAKNAIKLLQDKRLRQKIAYAGYEEIKKFNDWEKTISSLEEYVKEKIIKPKT